MQNEAYAPESMAAGGIMGSPESHIQAPQDTFPSDQAGKVGLEPEGCSSGLETGQGGSAEGNSGPGGTMDSGVQGIFQQAPQPQSPQANDEGHTCSCTGNDIPSNGGYQSTSPQMAPQEGSYQSRPQAVPSSGLNPNFTGAGQAFYPGQAQGSPYPQGMPASNGMPYGMAAPQGIYGADRPGPAISQPAPQFAGAGAVPQTAYGNPPQGYGNTPNQISYGQVPYGQVPYGQVPYGQAPHNDVHQTAQRPANPKYDEHQYGQFMEIIKDFANGNTDASRVMTFLEGLDTQFWKGTMIGVAVTLLLTNNTVKDTISGALSGALGIFQKDKNEQES